MIPYNTDAPLYHWPVATAALIVVNVLLFLVVPSERLQIQKPVAEFRDAEFNPFDPAPPEEEKKVDEDWDDDAFRIVDGAAEASPTDRDEKNAGVDDPSEKLVREAGRAQEVRFGRAENGAVSRFVLSLEHGTGLKPWQWLSSLFVHSDIVQLIFNLLALWAFGLVVEGKVGAAVFVAIYVGIGVSQAAVEQILMLASLPSVSMGSNGALLGLLGIAVVWAPRNEFDVLWAFGLRARTLEIPILMYGFLQLTMELVGISFGSFGVSSSLMHLFGLTLGLVVGWIWLRRGWVDCEGWDLIHVWKGTETGVHRDEGLEAEARQLVRDSTPSRMGKLAGKGDPTASLQETPLPQTPPKTKTFDRLSNSPAKTRKPSKSKPAEATSQLANQQRLVDIERLIVEGNVPLALKLLAKLRVDDPQAQLSQLRLFELIRALLAAKDYRAAIPFLREHIRQYSEQRIPLQLNLAKLLLHLQQPRKAMEILRAMQSMSLDATARATWKTLAHHAQHQIDEGVLEVSD